MVFRSDLVGHQVLHAGHSTSQPRDQAMFRILQRTQVNLTIQKLLCYLDPLEGTAEISSLEDE